MYQFLKNLKMNYVVSAIVCIVFGLTLVIWPDISSKVVCIGVGIVLLLSGIANLITYFGEKDRNLMTQISLIAGIILAVLGGWIILNPQILIMVIPVVMGVIVAVHGVHNLLQALELFKNEYSKWWVALLLGAVTVGLGVLLIFNPFEAVNTVIMLIGIFLQIKISVYNIQDVQQLALILVQALCLYVKNRVRVDYKPLLSLCILGKLLFFD